MSQPLRSSTVKVFSEALERIHAETDLASLPQRIFEVAETLLPGVFITIDEFNTQTKVARHACSRVAPDGWGQRIAELVPLEHPSYHALLAGAREPLRLSDLITRREFRRTALHHEVFAPMKINHQIALPLFIRNHVAGVTLNRDTSFSDEEVTLSRLLAPHIALAHVHAQHFTALQQLQWQTFPALEALIALGLTARQAEVMHWLAQGKRDGEIAEIICCQVRTVNQHVQHIFQKLNVETRTAAVAEAIRLTRFQK